MSRVLLVALLLLNSALVCSEVVSVTREYTYNASENDSKVSARKAAMQQLQSLVIQEVGVQVHSSFSNSETLDGADFSRKVQANYETFSQALTKTKILKEKWNGETFYLKAEITVDTENLVEKIKTVYVQLGGEGNPVSGEDLCKIRYQKVLDLLNEVRSRNVIATLLEMSTSHDFDRRCHRWQFTIISDFASANTESQEYRDHLFQSISNITSDAMAGELMVATLKYALHIAPLTDHEWAVVRAAISRSKPSATRSLIALLVEHTQLQNPTLSEKDAARNARRQSVSALQEKLSILTTLAKQSSISVNDPMSEADVANTIIYRTMNLQPSISMQYFMAYRNQLSQPQLSQLSSSIFNRFKKHPTDDMYQYLIAYTRAVEVDNRVASGAFQLFVHMKKNKTNDSRYIQYLNHYMANNKNEAASIINLARTSEHNKKLWLIEFDLSSDQTCKVMVCAEGLFAKNKRATENAADFLLAYGERAKPATAQVLKKLARLKALNKVGNDTRLVPKLIRILDNVNANTEKTYELLVWAIGDVSQAINEQAFLLLEKAGPKAFDVLVRLFPAQKATPQRRIIDVIGTYQSNKQQALAFVSSISPTNPKMRFAIEDAKEALSQ